LCFRILISSSLIYDEETTVVELSRKNMQKGQVDEVADRTTEHQREHVDKPAHTTCGQNMEKTCD
jgi:hypothetical protein